MLAPFQLTQLVGRHMIERGEGGAVVNIVSIASWMGIPRLGAYSASKAALMRWSESTAVEWGPYGIRINNVGPGFIQTDETRATWDDPEQLAQIMGVTPLGRIGQPADIGHACLFLASQAALVHYRADVVRRGRTGADPDVHGLQPAARTGGGARDQRMKLTQERRVPTDPAKLGSATGGRVRRGVMSGGLECAAPGSSRWAPRSVSED